MAGTLFDIVCRLAQNVPMRRLTIMYAICTLLSALVYAPLFHVHDADHGADLTIHAHFSGLDHHRESPRAEWETPEEQQQGRYLDLLTSRTTSIQTSLPFVAEEFFHEAVSPVQHGCVTAHSPQAHAPPPFDRSIPRSPPGLNLAL